MATKSTTPKPKGGAPAVPQTSLSQAMQASMRKFMIIAISATVLIAGVGGYFIWVLANQNITAANEVTAQGYYIDLATQKVKTLEETEKKLTELNDKGTKLVSDYELATNRALPDANDLGGILTMFQKLESNSLVKIDSISKLSSGLALGAAPTAGASGGKALPFQVSFKATGSYDQILKMLRALETSTRVFDFSTLKISGTAQSITLDMAYQVYYLPKQVPTDTKVPISEYKPEAKK